MNFNRHSHLVGKHAFLSASKYHWLNYTEERFDEVFFNHSNAQRGTELHDLAFRLIRLKVKLPKNKMTLNAYVNDVIGYRMHPELILYYSDNAYGTADALSFDKNNLLRIFDLKTGVLPTSEKQLWIYAALFCLEYGVNPHKIKYDLRIYQNDDVQVFEIDPDKIADAMTKIVAFDKRADFLRSQLPH